MSAKVKVSAFAAVLVLLLALPAVAEAKWGAIAINPDNGKIGYARNESTAVRAQNHARNECGESHCKVAVWVFNGYGAVVKKKNGLYISGIGKTKSQAFRNARKRANEQSAPAVAWVFSGIS